MQKSTATNTSQKFFGDLMQVTNINKKFTGTGGMTSSLAVKKPKQLPQLKKTGIFDPLPPEKSTVFKLHYDRGDLPISVSFNGATRKIKWWIELEKLGYKFYFPIFLEGLRETQEPYKFLAEQGCYGMIIRGKGKIKEVLPDIIFPIKKALQTKDPEIMCKTLRILQKLVLEHIEIGVDLVPYYRQLLPTLNLFVNKNKNMGDKMDYSQQKNMNLSELIMETLEILERYGGEDAYITIKYMIPTYESCVY